MTFGALALSMLYGAGFAVLDPTPRGYAALGGVVVALAWISIGFFARDDRRRDDRES